MAPRVLRFDQTQLYWECRELSACELYPHGLPNANQEWETTRKDKSFDLEPEPGVNKDPEAYCSRWHTILSKYAIFEMSKPNDKLLALREATGRLHQLSGSEYLAGLWENHLTHDLLWKAGYPGVLIGSYRAPIWSWTSLDCHLVPNTKRRSGKEGDAQSICTVIEASVTPSTSNRFGRVSSASRRINGSLRTLLTPEGKVNPPPNAYYLERLSTDSYFHRPDGSFLERDGRIEFKFNETFEGLEFRTMFGRFLCRYRKPEGHQLFSYEGLILTLTGSAHSEYQRIGVFEEQGQEEHYLEKAKFFTSGNEIQETSKSVN